MSNNHRSYRRKTQHRNPEHQWVVTEISVKLVVNGILSVVSVFTLWNLLSYQLSQQAKLQEVRVKVQETERRVDQLRDNFSHNFDPYQIKKVMEEQSPRLEPNQRRIFWLN